ncbi:MAG TPA: hypothetical protein VGR29_07150 [Thermomicrobiales bacterium]|nr:hypothetical protein [Thermomicrobiales bacterium]
MATNSEQGGEETVIRWTDSDGHEHVGRAHRDQDKPLDLETLEAAGVDIEEVKNATVNLVGHPRQDADDPQGPNGGRSGMTANEETSGKKELTISVRGEDGQRRDFTFEMPHPQGKPPGELTLNEVFPPELLALLEEHSAARPVTEDETGQEQDPSAAIFEAEARMAGSQITDTGNVQPPSPHVPETELGAVDD